MEVLHSIGFLMLIRRNLGLIHLFYTDNLSMKFYILLIFTCCTLQVVGQKFENGYYLNMESNDLFYFNNDTFLIIFKDSYIFYGIRENKRIIKSILSNDNLCVYSQYYERTYTSEAQLLLNLYDIMKEEYYMNDDISFRMEMVFDSQDEYSRINLEFEKDGRNYILKIPDINFVYSRIYISFSEIYSDSEIIISPNNYGEIGVSLLPRIHRMKLPLIGYRLINDKIQLEYTPKMQYPYFKVRGGQNKNMIFNKISANEISPKNKIIIENILKGNYHFQFR
jgi:hypothetical protein